MTPPARTLQERANGRVVVELSDDEGSPGHARKVVRETFSRWGLAALLDDAELAVSELVTNAIKHGLPPVVLTLCQTRGCVRMDVSDTRPATASREWPVSRDTDESGRGRAIVEAVSDQSGTDLRSGPGKSSFASWDVDSP